MIDLLAAQSRNLFMVGDEDQSIYGFRAAYPQALVSFEDRHPGAGILLMETNYRSRQEIVRAADTLIQKNKNRHPKKMTAAREGWLRYRDQGSIQTGTVQLSAESSPGL